MTAAHRIDCFARLCAVGTLGAELAALLNVELEQVTHMLVDLPDDQLDLFYSPVGWQLLGDYVADCIGLPHVGYAPRVH